MPIEVGIAPGGKYALKVRGIEGGHLLGSDREDRRPKGSHIAVAPGLTGYPLYDGGIILLLLRGIITILPARAPNATLRNNNVGITSAHKIIVIAGLYPAI